MWRWVIYLTPWWGESLLLPPCCPLNRRLSGLQGRSGRFGEEKMLFTCRDIFIRTSLSRLPWLLPFVRTVQRNTNVVRAPGGGFFFLFVLLFLSFIFSFLSVVYLYILYPRVTFLTHITQWFEPAIATGVRPQSFALNLSASGIGRIRTPDRSARTIVTIRTPRFSRTVKCKVGTLLVRLHLICSSCQEVSWCLFAFELSRSRRRIGSPRSLNVISPYFLQLRLWAKEKL